MAVVIATAGHIDHGKTALVRALTGQDTDRLPDEKARGISIDLGFAHLDVAAGERAGVVDVPGHERFIRNMLAGAHHVDLVLFVVAADDGVMPQTEEHLDILHLLGVRRGIFVVTKIDLVDAARVAAVREEIEILACGTTLEGAPVVPVSTLTGQGLDDLRDEIARHVAEQREPAPSTEPFRLPVDRAFVMHGHGVVVTGTAIAGVVRDGDSVRVLPHGDRVRVRKLEVHGAAVAEARRGQRVAMNLVGAERTDVGRGQVVCGNGIERTTDRFDAWIEVRPGARRPLASHTRVRVHVGTAEELGKVVILDGRSAIAPRETGWAQLVLATPVIALRGDRFVIRDETARRTLGGGIVANPFAARHRRGEPALVDRLTTLRDGDVASAARTLLALVPDFACERATIGQALNVEPEEVARALATADDVIALPDATRPEAYATSEKWRQLVEQVIARVTTAHRERPTEPGVEMEHLRSQVACEVAPRTFRSCIDRLVAEKRLARDDSIVRLPSHRVALDAGSRELGARVERLLADGRFTPPDVRHLQMEVAADRGRLIEVLSVLEKERRVVRVAPDLYYAPAAIEEAKALVAAHCRAHDEISAGVFRDLIGASRKFAIALLDWCDRTGVTTRVGDMRRLRRDVR
jgi:selenocysteine-specific elongation factor